MLYTKSGLLGVSGLSNDMRVLRANAATNADAKRAIDLFVYRITREIGSLVAALGGLDGLVFTAGIGENDVATRAEVIAGLGWAGLTPRRGRQSHRRPTDFLRTGTHGVGHSDQRGTGDRTADAERARRHAGQARILNREIDVKRETKRGKRASSSIQLGGGRTCHANDLDDSRSISTGLDLQAGPNWPTCVAAQTRSRKSIKSGAQTQCSVTSMR